MRLHELGGLLPFFLQESGLPDLCISSDLFIGGDPRPGIWSVSAIDVIVSEPKLERQIGPQWNQSVEDNVVADGPWCAAHDDDPNRKRRPSQLLWTQCA